MDQGLARHRGTILLCSVLSLVVGGVVGYFGLRAQRGTPISVSTPLPAPTASATATPTPLRVHVCGAVQQSAVYELPPGSIVQDAIDAAGGATAEADLTRVNLAFELADHQQVYIPRQGETDPPPPVSGGEAAEKLVNINTASAAELETLPRIGPTTAQSILEYREANGPFERIEDIQDVTGIGPATFETLKDLITIR